MNLHKEPKTQEELEEKREIVFEQTKRFLAIVDSARMKCPICKKYVLVYNMFRCFYCGLWLCKTCAKEHFSEGP